MMKFKKETIAIEELAKLLHVDRNEVHVLLARERRPLPFPRSSNPFDPWVFNVRYLTQLDAWVQEETSQPRTQCRLDASRVQTGIAQAKNSLAEYDFKDRFPPGYFLG